MRQLQGIKHKPEVRAHNSMLGTDLWSVRGELPNYRRKHLSKFRFPTQASDGLHGRLAPLEHQ